ncbi:hypothetical protein GCM10010532_007920 [Dactylosporangium siamense]|uniref:Uncharacterized protein n=1 Tax=Dactylosporangium siamense TaxID=685454 RepID=A0A919PFZ1_9ACTN|nr:hypothetical protein Dsi01nite_007030 [Dactylosporangium siamense]
MAVLLVCALGGCAAPDGAGAPDGMVGGPAPLRGFGVEVDEAVAPRVPLVHVRVCGGWGCHDQDVPLHISGPVSAMPCPSGTADPDMACGVAHLPGPGPGYGYAPVPQLTMDPVTVTVTTPAGAPLAITAELRVHPSIVCPGGAATAGATTSACAGGAPQAGLRISADGTVSQSR